jgi:hypothetical protein
MVALVPHWSGGIVLNPGVSSTSQTTTTTPRTHSPSQPRRGNYPTRHLLISSRGGPVGKCPGSIEGTGE